VEANVCIYANATILGGNTVIGKTVLLVEIHGLQNHSGRLTNHNNNRSKNKRTKIAWSLKLLDLIGNTPW
jgi:hypothetical protein